MKLIETFRRKTALILFNMSVYLFGCASLGSAIDQNASDNHYYNPSETAVIYADMGGDCYSIGCNEIEGADLETFKPLNNIYATDKNHVYHKHERLEGADAQTFKLLSDTYAADKTYVYYRDKTISAESPNAFKVAAGPYAVGSQAVYWAGEVVSTADPATFEAIAFIPDKNFDAYDYYGQDKKAIFCQKNRLSEQPTLFKSLDNGAYFIDGQDVYNVRDCASLGADPTTFEFLYKKDGSPSLYGKDSEKVFLLLTFNQVIENADPDTFEVLCSGVGSPDFAKDKNYIYSSGAVVEEANPQTFQFPEECQ